MKFIRKFSVVLLAVIFYTYNGVYCEEKDSVIINTPVTPKPWIGIKVNNYMKEAIKTETNDGVIIKDIVHNTVKLAGLKEGDIIKKIDNIDVFTIEDFNRILINKKIGDKIKLELIRNNEKQEITIVLEDAWKKTEEVLSNLGLKIKPIYKEFIFGIIVMDIIIDSKADKYGIKKNDIILGVNRSTFKNLDEFSEITSHVDLEKETYILVMRKDDQSNYITITKQIGEKKETKKEEESKKIPHSLQDE